MPDAVPMRTVLLLGCSNIFMTFAWYGHLKYGHSWPLWKAVVVSWAIAFSEGESRLEPRGGVRVPGGGGIFCVCVQNPDWPVVISTKSQYLVDLRQFLDKLPTD